MIDIIPEWVKPEGWYSRADAARALGVHPKTIDNWVKSDIIPVHFERKTLRKRFRGRDLIKRHAALA